MLVSEEGSKNVITIDGYSSTGKSSVSKAIASQIGFLNLDTGALYRGICLYALRNCREGEGIVVSDLIPRLREIHLEFRYIDGQHELFLNGENVSQEIRSIAVSSLVSLVAQRTEVRDYLLPIQKKMIEKGGVVMEGRDAGTVVCPEARYKFFLTADIDTRAERRLKELLEKGVITDIEKVKENLLLRDRLDEEREISPLVKARDAILIDNTQLNGEETAKLILSHIRVTQ